jgi:hypothetical protein
MGLLSVSWATMTGLEPAVTTLRMWGPNQLDGMVNSCHLKIAAILFPSDRLTPGWVSIIYLLSSFPRPGKVPLTRLQLATDAISLFVLQLGQCSLELSIFISCRRWSCRELPLQYASLATAAMNNPG